ncbi:putative TOM core complex subunit Tom6 [Myriangium duriaei CBS 260.36]|uniref:TOM core complex subunit Tom6 n=1 Tax=Myriangium duriaei CBS 260.36 TaxID=1168546 RepID=A0A9P4IUS3_9PEZI|nr:putative TOM core complex subunit Tom6 [Myriangium duriaei CBS 260.36]
MPPKRYVVAGPGSRQSNPGYLRSVYDSLAAPDNRSIVTAVGFFAAGVAFLHSSWSEILKPP